MDYLFRNVSVTVYLIARRILFCNRPNVHYHTYVLSWMLEVSQYLIVPPLMTLREWVSKWVSKWVLRDYMYTIWETRTYKEISPLINQSFMTKNYLSATNTLTHIITSHDHNELREWWMMYTVSFITFYCTTLNCTALRCTVPCCT